MIPGFFKRMTPLVRSVVLLGLALHGFPYAVGATPGFETHVYKKIGSLEIKADVYQPNQGSRPRPVVVYLHGGSLINGRRQAVASHPMVPLLLTAGCVVVSIDYRLAPETKLPAVIDDVEDAFRWVREKGPALFDADPARVAASGGSAGGYLTLVAGYRVRPRPKVLFAEMSYGDLIGAWQLQPTLHPPHYSDSHLSEAEAWQQVSGPPVANANDRQGDGGAFNDYIRRSAQWPKAISGWDPRTDADKFLPYLPLRNVTSEYPPTILIHGENDTDVPIAQPRMMAAELTRLGIEHRLIQIPGAEHGFRGGEPAAIAAARREAVEFILRHLMPVPPSKTPVSTNP